MRAILLLIFLIYSSSYSTDYLDVNFDNPPSNQGNGGVYQGNVGNASIWVTQGASLEHLPTGGWDGLGAAKFTPHDGSQAAQAYTGLVPSCIGNWPQVNLRFLIYWSNNFSNNCTAEENKWTMLNRVSGGDGSRTWISHRGVASAVGGGKQIAVNFRNTEFFVHGENVSCPYSTYVTAKCEPNFYRCANNCPPFLIENYEAEWVCVEFEARNDGTLKAYIWTLDGSFEGAYLWTDQGPQLNAMSWDIIGGFWNGSCSNGAYFIFDEMKISDQFIGPPSGFLNINYPPGKPEGMLVAP